jgi:DNA polymerase III subunit gamma/tau
MKSLAIKYRPSKFEEVVGQDLITKILQHQIDKDIFTNAYLFVGGAGTGKTTSARIFANEINKGKGTPVEIDAASNNGINDVRQIIEDAKHRALDSEYKVYILDECHQFSISAWQGLLKLIEEPPKYTIFLFCTTDAHKIPNTILSRVQRYDFKKISTEKIHKRLEEIVFQENIENANNPEGTSHIKLSYAGAEYISKLANGGMRDALTLLDRIIVYTNDITVENIIECLGLTRHKTMFDLNESILDNDELKIIELIEDIENHKLFLKDYISFILDCYKYYITKKIDYTLIPNYHECTLKEYTKEDYIFLKSLLPELLTLNANIKFESDCKVIILATLLNFCEN